MRLNLGCGHAIKEGWVNIDRDAHPGVFVHDLSTPLPFEDGSVEEIYSEHFIEHINEETACKLLEECYRVLAPGGRIRISTPDLDTLVESYLFKKLNFYKSTGWFPGTPCRMLNEGMRLWGHQFLYNLDELGWILQGVGFREVMRVKIDPAYECRPDNNDLVVTAIK